MSHFNFVIRYLSLSLLILAGGLHQTALSQSTQIDEFRTLLNQAFAKSDAQQWAEAVPLWEKVVQINPVEGELWDMLAEAHYHNKQFQKAIPAYEKRLELRYRLPADSAYGIARCYAQLGDKKHALEWLEKAMNLGYRRLDQAKRDPDLGSLRGDSTFHNLLAMEDTSKMSHTAGWRYDLQLLSREIKRQRFYPFRNISAEQFDAEIKKIGDAIPKLTDMQITTEMMKLIARVGDAHTTMYAFWERPEFLKTIPVDFFFFNEGLFITASDDRYTDLLGAQVLRFDDRTVEEIMKGIDPIVSRDNENGPKIMGLMRLRILPLIHALGLINNSDKVTLTIRDAKGQTRSVTLPGDSGIPSRKLLDSLPPNWKALHQIVPGPVPIYLKNTNEDYWFEYLPDAKIVYFQLNHVRNSDKEPLAKFSDRLVNFINEHDVEKLVVDLRLNPGGDTTITLPLIWALIRCEKVNQRGKLFAIIGRRTFSAAQNVATFIERNTRAIFVGEPTGSSPNFIGEDNAFEMPYSKIMVSVSDYYWASSWPFDNRTWIAPLFYIPPSFESYRANRDPVMEAIIAYKAKR